MNNTLINAVNTRYDRAEQTKRDNEILELGNKPGTMKRVAVNAEIEALKKELETEKKRNYELMTWMIVAMVMSFGLSIICTLLMGAMLLR